MTQAAARTVTAGVRRALGLDCHQCHGRGTMDSIVRVRVTIQVPRTDKKSRIPSMPVIRVTRAR
jgi:hypothetical protein